MPEPVTLTVGAIAMAVSAISAIVSMLSFWMSKRYSVSVRLKRGDVSIKLSSIDEKDARKVIEQLLAAGDENEDITVEVREGVADGR